MKKSGLGDSPLFLPPKDKNEVVNPPLPILPDEVQGVEKITKTEKQKPKQPSSGDTTTPRHRDTTIPRYQDTIFEQVRKAVKELGKEAATHRFTQEEKRAITDIIYTYKNNGIKTSENEVARISVNFIIEDYRENGENSILHKVLKALNE
uniref:Uncharacterized protein n=1 Tax=candidate division WOR-3 bacterium TaxID=2052148 RepID=A0A7V3NVA9_UNCW3